MPDNDETNVTPVGPPPSRAEFDALSRRVNAMATAAQRLATYSSESGDNKTEFDPAQQDTRPRPGVVSPPNPLLHISLPAYVAASLAQVENALLHRDVALQVGDDDIAREFEEQAAGLACVALARATDELQIPAEVSIDQSYSNFLRTGQSAPPGMDISKFRDQEVHLLRLAGLSQELAVKHLEAAFETFHLSTISIATKEDVRKALKAGQTRHAPRKSSSHKAVARPWLPAREGSDCTECSLPSVGR